MQLDLESVSPRRQRIFDDWMLNSSIAFIFLNAWAGRTKCLKTRVAHFGSRVFLGKL